MAATGPDHKIPRFPMGLQIKQQQKDTMIVKKVRGKLMHWTNKKLSLVGRILISN